jgi:hypothetical protein
MKKPLDFWRDALNKPVALANSPAACTSLFFPNKRLSANLARDDPGTPTGDSPVKAALLKKQEALFEQLKLEQTQAPLIAHFSKPEWVARYQASRHMDDRVGDNALACAVGVCADYYFPPEIVPSGAGMTPVKQDNSVYKVHVDFANKALGGAWRQAHGYAQEEIAFLENTGLGAVAQHATKVQETAQGAAIQISKHTNFGATFSTRINNTPAPLLIEGCVRVAQFGSYGRAAMNLSKEKALNSLKQAQPETTNWLAIAAPDLRPTSRLNLTRAEQFTDIFGTAHAGFSMTNAIADGKKVEIHTGKLGCGVFKNDVTISIAAQLLAAKLTGIAHVQFHDIDNEDAARFNEVKATIDRCIAESLAAVPREKIGALVGRTFQAIETNRLINRRSAAA